MKYNRKPRNEVDTMLRKEFNGMYDQDMFTMTYSYGFEKFGAYETWDGGWIIRGKGRCDKEIVETHSRIDSAVKNWLTKHNKRLEEMKNEQSN